MRKRVTPRWQRQGRRSGSVTIRLLEPPPEGSMERVRQILARAESWTHRADLIQKAARKLNNR